MAKDHFVSQFYLRGFTDPSSPNPKDPGVWVVDSRYPGAPKRRSPAAIAFEPGYNDWTDPTDSRAAISLEEEYGELESWAAPIIRKLDRRDVVLSMEEREKLAMFVAVHMSRPPGVRELVASTLSREEQQRLDSLLADDSFVRDVIGRMESHKPADERSTVEEIRSLLSGSKLVVETHPNNVKAAAYAWPLVRLTPLILQCRWALRVAAKGRSLLTCDRPIVVLTSDRARPLPDYSLKDNSHISMFFPLTRHVALEVAGQREVPSGSPSHDLDRRLPISRLPPSQTTLRNRATIQMSDRFIFCSDETQAQWALAQLQREGRSWTVT